MSSQREFGSEARPVAELLSDIGIQRELGGLPGWSRRGNSLTKTYRFPDLSVGNHVRHARRGRRRVDGSSSRHRHPAYATDVHAQHARCRGHHDERSDARAGDRAVGDRVGRVGSRECGMGIGKGVNGRPGSWERGNDNRAGRFRPPVLLSSQTPRRLRRPSSAPRFRSPSRAGGGGRPCRSLRACGGDSRDPAA